MEITNRFGENRFGEQIGFSEILKADPEKARESQTVLRGQFKDVEGNVVKVSLTAEDVDDIVTTMLEGGITYWCEEAEVKGGNAAYHEGYASEVVSVGETLILKYDEGETGNPKNFEQVELTLDKFAKGLAKYLEENPELVNSKDADGNDAEYGCIDFFSIDACAADVVCQYAVFNELMFG